jgi:L-lactate dehydrogenase complex protein LldG
VTGGVSARNEVLARVRSALGDDRGRAVHVPREYRAGDDASHEQVVQRFAERVADYRASVRRAAAGELAGVLAEACREGGAARLGVPPGLPEEWLPAGVELVPDGGLSPHDLDALDGALTGCALAIAETGTVVLDGGPYSGRRALTLVPDYHLCVVSEEQVVGLVPEAVARLEEAAREGRPLTFVSGPSATSDIELSRVEGVHGPRTLHVVIVA